MPFTDPAIPKPRKPQRASACEARRAPYGLHRLGIPGHRVKAKDSVVTHAHFISGLPRSGSTLLCALLRQNPRFRAAMTSPVAMLASTLHQKMCGGEFAVFFDDAKRAAMMRGVFDSYYDGIGSDHVVFDTNRMWTGCAALLGELYPQSRIICCVRGVGWIIDSIERMLDRNPLQLSRMFNFQPGASVYSRVETLMNSDTGLIGLARSTLREAWFGEQADRLIIVPYDNLVRHPERTLSRLYEALGEASFAHDLENVTYDEPDYDALLGMPGLHKVR
ncbi:sulfotransferase family protein [Paraburkholderia terricola]|uniref:Sulfotransferase n=1 Tax=Paraburkholderia terricola TaxID=169427 RepID=A0ABU1M1M2_9BURK|nr:sulfotransferase [Paraburkholderia terricola]MDR6412893.1 sulfotransferase [Paraburkholderia terricola]MDR6484748.1 sulfotransferase [Paraburkholderia terricola]